MKVACLTEDWSFDPEDGIWIPNGAPFYRCALPHQALISAGIDAKMGRPRFSMKDGFGIDDGSFGKFGFDVVMLKLMMHKSQLAQVKRARELGQRIIVDVDDFFPGVHHTNAAQIHLSAEADPVRNMDWHEKIVLAADTVTVSTPFLLDYYSQRHPDVRMVRNGVVPLMFDRHTRIQENIPTIGWMGAVGWRSEDLEILRGWLPEYIAKRGYVFHHSGHMNSQPLAVDLIGIPPKGNSIMYMQPIHRLWKLMVFDIGLVPLNDIPFNHAKSNLKGLEYAAAGIPFVASDLPEYRLLAEAGVGTVATTDDEWLAAVEALRPRKARVEAAEAAREIVLRDFTIGSRTSEWVSVVERGTRDEREPADDRD